VRVLSRNFRGKLLAFFKRSYRRSELCFPASWLNYQHHAHFILCLAPGAEQSSVVYSKPPFGAPGHVLKYLANYTHRVAIYNGRLLSLDNRQVRFRSRNCRHNHRSGAMKLDTVEFIRRFLLHVLPPVSSRFATSGCLPTATGVKRCLSADSISLPLPQRIQACC
jgi:hypothetical protein